MTNLKLPFEIQGYRIVRRLGLGGMATVYLAIQRSLGRPVAVKVLATDHTQSEELVKRFEHEARTIARLDHPHIVNIFDVGRTSSGQIYYTMPYLPNGDLATRNLREDQARILDIMRALADALGYAHEHGIVHRDVKPENVLFDKLDRPMLADFGIALSDSLHMPRVTREGATIGSSGYMSPEQARSQPLDGRSDIYSLGVLCYELLTGEMPFRGPDTLSVALAHIEKPVPRLPQLRRVWQPFIDKALAKRPEVRYQDAEEVLAALDAIEARVNAPPAQGPTKWWNNLVERTVAIPRRTRALAIGLLITIALAGLVALLPHVPGPVAVTPRAEVPAAQEAASIVSPAAADAAVSPLPSPAAPTEPLPPVVDPERLLAEAKDAAAKGRLFAPKNDNAADRYLAVLHIDPHRKEAIAGLDAMFEPLGERTHEAIAAADIAAAGATIDRALSLADEAALRKSKLFAAYKTSVHEDIEHVRNQVRDPFDVRAIAPLVPLLPHLEKLDHDQARALKADLDRPSVLLGRGGRFHDRGGPELAVVPSDTNDGDRPYALGTTDITRGAFAQFANATGRAPSRCRESQRLFARSKDLSWRDPGFAQDDDHPVVCVSWNDAYAYADWLSQRTGQHYRLPTQQEWLRAAPISASAPACGSGNFNNDYCKDGFEHTAPVGHFPATRYGLSDMVGNVGVWTSDCAGVRESGNCREHVIRGLSWHDDRDSGYLQREETSGNDIGYATTGFRVLREISADNARPPKS